MKTSQMHFDNIKKYGPVVGGIGECAKCHKEGVKIGYESVFKECSCINCWVKNCAEERLSDAWRDGLKDCVAKNLLTAIELLEIENKIHERGS